MVDMNSTAQTTTSLSNTIAAAQEHGPAFISRDDAIKAIRTALKQRSGKAWSVTGGKGTAWGWISITAPPKRRDGGCMTDADRTELGVLLGLARPVHCQGQSIAASNDHRVEYVNRAEGRAPIVHGEQYWD